MVNTCAGAAMISLRQVQPSTPPSTGSGGVVHAAEAIPVPWQQCRQIGDLVIGDACEHVGEPSLRINIVELGRLNQCQHYRGALAAAIGAGEEPDFRPSAIPLSVRSAALLLRQILPSSRKRVKGSMRLSMLSM